MLLRCVLFPFVHLHCVEVAILTVCQHPHFDSAFYRLFGKALFQCRAALKFDHCLIDGYITPLLIDLITTLVDHVNDWADLGKSITARCTRSWNGGVVTEVRVPPNVPKSFP